MIVKTLAVLNFLAACWMFFSFWEHVHVEKWDRVVFDFTIGFSNLFFSYFVWNKQ